MRFFAIADPHLSSAHPKPMDIFGGNWHGHPDIFFARWREVVRDSDVVLIPGDISWAMSLEDALVDLRDIADLPGHKLILRGNHDYWWSSISKVRNALPERMQALQHDAFAWDVSSYHITNEDVGTNENVDESNVGESNVTNYGKTHKPQAHKPQAQSEVAPAGISKVQPANQHRIVVAGTRGWDCPGSRQFDADDEHNSKIYARERQRLELSLQHAAKLAQAAASSTLIVMLHYPPSNLQAEPSAFTELLRHYQADIVVYGHVHGYDPEVLQPPIANAQVHLVAADALGFVPKVLLECSP